MCDKVYLIARRRGRGIVRSLLQRGIVGSLLGCKIALRCNKRRHRCNKVGSLLRCNPRHHNRYCIGNWTAVRLRCNNLAASADRPRPGPQPAAHSAGPGTPTTTHARTLTHEGTHARTQTRTPSEQQWQIHALTWDRIGEGIGVRIGTY